MRSYNLKWDEKMKGIILSYSECRKVYLDNADDIKLLLNENISQDNYHLYEYNRKIHFLIKDIVVNDEKIEHITLYLLSNDLEEVDNLYSKIGDKAK